MLKPQVHQVPGDFKLKYRRFLFINTAESEIARGKLVFGHDA